MKDDRRLSKGLSIVGTVLVWLPIAFTLLTALVGSLASRHLRFDYLMPAELFPVALVGGLLLLWAAWRARSRHKPVALGLGAMVLLLVGGQALAVVTGLASGATQPGGWAWALVLSSLALYSLALVWVGVTGVMLIRELYGRG